MLEVSLLGALLMGFTGGVHCIGMCGGIVSALSLGTASNRSERERPGPFNATLPILIAYNSGRIASYTLAGAVIGGAGALVGEMGALPFLSERVAPISALPQLITGLFLIALGLYLGQWWRGLLLFERMGSHLWRRIEPLGRGLLPVRGIGQAVALGAVWGWLPCGLVYTALIWAGTTASVTQGGLLLFAFGLGTLPNLLLMGVLGAELKRLLQQRWVSGVAGATMILMGVWTLIQPFR